MARKVLSQMLNSERGIKAGAADIIDTIRHTDEKAAIASSHES